MFTKKLLLTIFFKYVNNVHLVSGTRDVNSQPLDYEFPPLTTRPLPFVFHCLNSFVIYQCNVRAFRVPNLRAI